MTSRAFGIMSPRDLHVIRVFIIIILFWIAIWNLTEEAITYIHEEYNICRWKIYAGIALTILGIIIVDPYTFEKL